MYKAKSALCVILFASSFMSGVVIDQKHVYCQGATKPVSVLRTRSGFSVIEGSRVKAVMPHAVDKNIRKLSQKNLSRSLNNAYMSVLKNNDGEYSIQHVVRGNGGGPITGAAVQAVGRPIGYGVAAVVTLFAAWTGWGASLIPEIIASTPEAVEAGTHAATAIATAIPFLP